MRAGRAKSLLIASLGQWALGDRRDDGVALSSTRCDSHMRAVGGAESRPMMRPRRSDRALG